MKRTVTIALALFSLAGCEQQTSSDQGETTSDPVESADEHTLVVAESFLAAAGSGDMEALTTLMTEDFVWHNEGDNSIPWIGTWEGKQVVLGTFLPAFGSGLQVTSWTTDYRFASGDQAVFMGTMSADATNTGATTGEMSWAVRVHVVGNQVKSWNWFEDSFAVSRAFHAEAAE